MKSIIWCLSKGYSIPWRTLWRSQAGDLYGQNTWCQFCLHFVWKPCKKREEKNCFDVTLNSEEDTLDSHTWWLSSQWMRVCTISSGRGQIDLGIITPLSIPELCLVWSRQGLDVIFIRTQSDLDRTLFTMRPGYASEVIIVTNMHKVFNVDKVSARFLAYSWSRSIVSVISWLIVIRTHSVWAR